MVTGIVERPAKEDEYLGKRKNRIPEEKIEYKQAFLRLEIFTRLLCSLLKCQIKLKLLLQVVCLV